MDVRLRVALAMFSVGLLAFIFMDVTSHAQELVQYALQNFKRHRTGLLHVVRLFALLATVFAVGTIGIAISELSFYALAGGAIMYVIGEIWTATRRWRAMGG